MDRSNLDNYASDIDDEKHQLPAIISRNEKTVKNKFWKKVARVFRFIPFAHELLSAYYCAIDPDTPTRVRAILLAALAYFILPADLVPDFIVGLGFSDDATVITAAISIVAGHISDAHKSQAKSVLQDLNKESL